ncbi:MAG: hypothetical protein EZS28_045976 [Streblomastix strix]|uniref:Uncharacterized protein n=1 Tax=Streblomastix strix TaxID=222440 RepID=A0A5J4TJR0_9EUKA|nr:MAG: hypothetical protein EZS28_045976 [Streblomastix strix]
MVLMHSLSQVASLDSLQRYYRVSAHRRRTQPQVSMIQTKIFTRIRKRNANVQKGRLLSPRAAVAAQDLVGIIKRTQEGASAGDIVYQLRVRVDQVVRDHRVGISITNDITINIAAGTANFGKKWPRQWEYIELPSSTRTRWNRETPGGAEIQPNETSHAYADCAKAVSLAECAQIAEIHRIITDKPPSRYLIDAYLMCLTAGARQRSIRFAHPSKGQSMNQASSNFRSDPAQFPPAHENSQYYGRRNNYRERGHKQLNDNQRAQNRERRAEQNPQ